MELNKIKKISILGILCFALNIPVLQGQEKFFRAIGERAMAAYFGEDFELVFTLPADAADSAKDALSVPVTTVGEVTDRGVVAYGDPVPDEGYTHAGD